MEIGIDVRPSELFRSRHDFFKGEERRVEEETKERKKRKKRKEDEKKDAPPMPTIKYPDDRPKKNSWRAESKRQKGNVLGLSTTFSARGL